MNYPLNSFVFWTSIVLIALMCVWKISCRRRLNLDKYEYLTALSFTEWKQGRAVRKELETTHGGWIAIGEFYINMTQLEEEGFVEHKDDFEKFEDDGSVTELKLRSYRRKPGGRRTEDKAAKLRPVLNPAFAS